MRFEFATSTRIVFGNGVLREAGPAARELGKRALLVSGRPRECAGPLIEHLHASGVASVPFAVEGEPELSLVSRGVELAKSENCDIVISFGGGSSIDAG